MKFLFIFILSSCIGLGAFAQSDSCSPSSESCDFYSCAEESVGCGARGYLKNFGEPNCKKFLNSQKSFSSNVQRWLPEVRLCLQQKLQNLDFRSCRDLGRKAMDSHVDCYIETGFCELNLSEKLEVFQKIYAEFIRVSALATALRIESACKASKHFASSP